MIVWESIGDKNMTRKEKLLLFVISLALMLLLSYILPLHRNDPNEDRYLYGFPSEFLIIYGEEFFLTRGGTENMPPLRRRFLFDLLQFFVNILQVYICLRILISISKKIRNKFKKHRVEDVKIL